MSLVSKRITKMAQLKLPSPTPEQTKSDLQILSTKLVTNGSINVTT